MQEKCNGNGEVSQNKTERTKLNKSIKEKLNIVQSHTLGTMLKYLGAKSNSDSSVPQDPTLNFTFRWMDGVSAICIFGTQSMNFNFFAHLYTNTEFERPRVLCSHSSLYIICC